MSQTASKKTTVAQAKQEQPADLQPSAVNVPVNTHFPGDVFNRLSKYKKDKGLLFEQDVVRLAVAHFLEKSGY